MHESTRSQTLQIRRPQTGICGSVCSCQLRRLTKFGEIPIRGSQAAATALVGPDLARCSWVVRGATAFDCQTVASWFRWMFRDHVNSEFGSIHLEKQFQNGRDETIEGFCFKSIQRFRSKIRIP